MDKNSVFGELIEKGQSTTTNSVSDVVNSFKGQATGDSQQRTQNQTNAPVSVDQQRAVNENQANQESTNEMVKEFYAPSDRQPNPDATPQHDQAKLAQLRQELHTSVYYDPLFAYERKKEEERVADRIEREDKDKKEELQLEEVKKQDTNVALHNAQTTTEINRGVAG